MEYVCQSRIPYLLKVQVKIDKQIGPQKKKPISPYLSVQEHRKYIESILNFTTRIHLIFPSMKLFRGRFSNLDGTCPRHITLLLIHLGKKGRGVAQNE